MHAIFDANELFAGHLGCLKLFDEGGALLGEWRASDAAVGDPSPDPYGHDCPIPPGDYEVGLPEKLTPALISEGFYQTPILDGSAQLLAAHGRSGLFIHGGGSASPDPLAPEQGFYPTYGCIRLQNADNEQFVQARGTRECFLTVIQ